MGEGASVVVEQELHVGQDFALYPSLQGIKRWEGHLEYPSEDQLPIVTFMQPLSSGGIELRGLYGNIFPMHQLAPELPTTAYFWRSVGIRVKAHPSLSDHLGIVGPDRKYEFSYISWPRTDICPHVL